MVTGRISFFSPEYSPISSSVSDVRSISSRFHCRPATVLVTRISVVAPRLGHRRRADERLARAARQHHHAGAALPERVGGHLLVVAQVPVLLVAADRVRLAVDVAGEILCGPTDLEQHLLDAAALAVVHDDGVVVDAGAEHRGDLLVAQHLLEHRAVQARPGRGRAPGSSPAAGGRSGPSCRRCRRAAAAAPRSGRSGPARRRPARRRGPAARAFHSASGVMR